jgi:hypothetical protein
MAEMLYSLVDGQQLAIVGALLLLGRVEILEKKASSCASLSRLVAVARQTWRHL